jgi:hypothetical protein
LIEKQGPQACFYLLRCGLLDLEFQLWGARAELPLPLGVRARLRACAGVKRWFVMPMLQGIKCGAEIGAWGLAAFPTMLSFSSTLGFLHRAPSAE